MLPDHPSFPGLVEFHPVSLTQQPTFLRSGNDLGSLPARLAHNLIKGSENLINIHENSARVCVALIAESKFW
jgi:hypothetical protein